MIFKEFKFEYSYFDMFKMLIRILITILFNLFDQYVEVLVGLISTILLVYGYLSTRLLPYIHYMT
jgi:hypothetical protein